MSWYDHVKDGTAYPEVLLETGMNDLRVDPWEMGKMTARLQAATTSGSRCYLQWIPQPATALWVRTREQADEQLADVPVDDPSRVCGIERIRDFNPQRQHRLDF